jgi:hypothetical protein
MSKIKNNINYRYGSGKISVGIVISQEDDSDEEDEGEVRFEGYLYKITQSKKIKKLWFKLVHKDLYYFKNKEETAHKGMHNLSGVYVKEEQPIQYDGQNLLCFAVVYPKKNRNYYVDNQKDYTLWLKYIRKSTGYSNLTDIYDVKVK